MKRILLIAFLPMLALGQGKKSVNQIAEQVTLNKTFEGTIQKDEIHAYQIKLESRQFVYGRVEQKGVDIVIDVFNPAGKKIEAIDSPTGTQGFENILFVSEQAGNHILKIHPLDPLAEQGRYIMKIERIEAAASTVQGRVDQLFTPWDRIDSPGAAIAVVRDGELIYTKGYGAANLEYDIPITPATVFHMASVSKQFTAYAIAALAQEGRLSLDDDIRKHLPEVPDFGVKITIRHLIHHTSGLRDQWNLLVMAGWRMDDVITKEHVLKLVQHQKELNFTPGAEYLYCNTGYTLMAEIVARITGQPFPQWAEENIFKPLNMKNTLFYDDHQKIVANRAYSYGNAEGGSFRKSVLSYANVGATSLFTTAKDLSRWAMNFNDPVTCDRDLIELMEQRGVLNNGDTISYAFGQGIGTYKGLRLIGHSGGDAGYRTYLGRFPRQKFAVMVLSNLGSFNPSSMAFKIADIFLEDLLVEDEADEKQASDQTRIAIDPALLEEYAGIYEIQPGMLVTIARSGSRLMGQIPGTPRVELAPMTVSRFRIEGENVEITFQRDESGQVDRLIVLQGEEETIAKRIEPFTLEPEKLAEFQGDYFSEELGTTYSIMKEDSVLIARHRRHDDFSLTPQSEDVFTGNVWYFGRIQFERDGDNRITGFRASSGRVRNLKFDKKE